MHTTVPWLEHWKSRFNVRFIFSKLVSRVNFMALAFYQKFWHIFLHRSSMSCRIFFVQILRIRKLLTCKGREKALVFSSPLSFFEASWWLSDTRFAKKDGINLSFLLSWDIFIKIGFYCLFFDPNTFLLTQSPVKLQLHLH